jgi:hypothetical protein
MGLTPEQMAIADKMKKQSKGAHKKVRHEEPVVGGGLPGGITGGVGRFMDYKFSEKEGKITVSFSATCVTPEEHEGVRFQVMHFLSESEYNSIEEAYQKFYGDLQLLGIDTKDDDHEDLAQIFADLEVLKTEKRFFKFNTWKKDASSRTRVFIQGLPDNEELAQLEKQHGTGDASDPEPADADDGGSEPSEDSAEEADEGDWAGPEDGEVWGYKPNSKSAEVECTVKDGSVDAETQTCVLIRNDNGKEYQKVKWDKLIGG